MRFIKRLLGSEKDPILEKCSEIAHSNGISLDDNEWQFVKHERDVVASSVLGGAYVHKDIFHSLCFLSLYDGLFKAGIEWLKKQQIKDTIHSLEKARSLLIWPTVSYGLGHAYRVLGDYQKAKIYLSQALENFDKRIEILNKIIPESLPSTHDFIILISKQLNNQMLHFGFENEEECKKAI